MANKFGDAVRDTVAKARKTRDKYVSAAKDLARAPGAMKDVVALKTPHDAFDRAEELQRKSRRK